MADKKAKEVHKNDDYEIEEGEPEDEFDGEEEGMEEGVNGSQDQSRKVSLKSHEKSKVLTKQEDNSEVEEEEEDKSKKKNLKGDEKKAHEGDQTKKQQLEQEATNLIFQTMRNVKDGPTRKEIEDSKLSHKQRAINKLRQQAKINDTFAALIGIGGMVVALIEYNIYYSGNNTTVNMPLDAYIGGGLGTSADWSGYMIPARNISTPFTTTLRVIVTLSTIVLLLTLVLHMILNHRLGVLQEKVKVEVPLISTVYFRTFIVEVLLNLVHCPPFFNFTFEFSQIGYYLTYSLDLIMSNFMLVRIYLAFRLFSHYTKWRSALSIKYCDIEGCEASTSFALRASLKESPYISLLFAFILSAILLGIPVMNFESPLMDYIAPGSYLNFNLWNSVWLIIITMVTVGFGDYYARSHIARLACVLSIFWGVFLTSMMVVTLTNSMSLDAKEQRAFQILFRLTARENLKHIATTIVTLMIRANALAKDTTRRKNGLDPSIPQQLDQIKELDQKYEADKAEIYSRLDILKTLFNEANAELNPPDVDAVEEIRKLSVSIEHDFNEMKNFHVAIKEIEANLMSIKKSHEVIVTVIDNCKSYNELFKKEINLYKGGIFKAEKS